MNRFFRTLVVLAVLHLLALSDLNAGELQAGAATSNITPHLGQPIIGGFVPFPSTHVHDELHARCLVLDDGTTKLAIVVCDLLGIHRNISLEARRRIHESVGIPAENVLICATHTHSASSAIGQNRYKLDAPLDDYQIFVARRIADGVARAANELRPAELAFGTVEVREHVHNRRWSMKPGTMPPNPFGGIDLVKMNPPRGNPNLEAPAGPTDPSVSIIALRQPDGTPISVFASYSLHYVGGVGRGHISADYFAMFAKHLAVKLDAAAPDSRFVAMMANGTSGDINNINFRMRGSRKEPYEQMRYVAHDVAEKVFAAMQNFSYSNDMTLAARYRNVEVRWRRPDPEMKQWAKETIQRGPQGERDLSFIYANRVMNLVDLPDTTDVPIQVLHIGAIRIGTMPTEVFCEIGLEFKQRSARKPAFLVSLAHGYLGYLPTPRQHKLGGYETWLGTNRLEVNASDILLDALLEMVEE